MVIYYMNCMINTGSYTIALFTSFIQHVFCLPQSTSTCNGFRGVSSSEMFTRIRNLISPHYCIVALFQCGKGTKIKAIIIANVSQDSVFLSLYTFSEHCEFTSFATPSIRALPQPWAQQSWFNSQKIKNKVGNTS